jgi:hypothetical protein
MITLKTLHLATAQEVFDQVAKHLLTQGCKSESLDDSGLQTCKYRGENGTSCAAGCLIADDEYDPEMEGHTWKCLKEYGFVGEHHYYLIADLQFIHDYYPPSEWRKELSIYAVNKNLSTKLLDEFV